jgi:type II secretory pathway pseudopilin PulG
MLIKICKQMKSRNGFTRVEAIVMAAIAAILIAIGIPLYIGYINDSTQNAAQNTASSAKSFLTAARADAIDFASKPPVNLKAGEQWIFSSKKPGANGDLIWTCPLNASIFITGNSLAANVKRGAADKTSSVYSF